jgi:hypothetical protein
MEKYIMKWLDGAKSGIPLTKQQVATALTNWYKKDGWVLITIENTKTNETEVFSEDMDMKTVTVNMIAV